MELLIKQSNFERIATEKISQMSFLNLMSLISSYKSINMITPTNTLYKYICYYAPYRPKINVKEQKILLTGDHNYATMTNAINSIKKMKKDKQFLLINENPIEFNMKINRGLQRFQKVEINLRNSEYNKMVILIQKYIRSFLKRIAVIRIIDSIIIEKCIIFILKIQSAYRKFYLRRNFKVNHIINKIIDYRRKKADQLKNILYSYEVKVNTKKEMMIQEILKQRYEKITLIQNSWRNKLYRDSIFKLIQLEKSQYTFTYPYYAKKVQLKICYNERKNKIFKIYNFEICPIRKIFVLHINYSELTQGKYYCQFLVDNYLTADRRFPTLEGKDKQFYNIIEFTQKGILNHNGSLYNINHSYKTGTSSYNMENNDNNMFNFNMLNNNYNNNYNSNNNYNNYNYGFNGNNNYGYVNMNQGYQNNNNYNTNNNNNNYYNYGYMGPFNNNNYAYNKYSNQINDEEAFNSLKKNLTGKVMEFSNNMN